MKYRILAGLLALSLSLSLVGCGKQPVQLPEQGEAPEIAYVPLDDRPDNVERVVYLAESLGYSLAMPPLNDFRTRLAGQPKNDNGTQYGDGLALSAWVLEREAAGCDRYLLSMDQLLSGGLVNSRSMHNQPESELTEMESLLGALSEDPENEIWLFDSVMRLAPTVGYDHWDLEGYNALRNYGMAPRPQLSGADLRPETIRADYRRGGDGEELSPQSYDLAEWEVEEYLSARFRKLELSTAMMEFVENREQFHVLFGIDDSAEEDSIQKNEIAYLRSLLREGDALLSGVDDLAFKAVTQLYLEESGWTGATAAVRYFGGMEQEAACAYDYQPLERIMEEHFEFFGLREAPAETAELQILVLTQPAVEEQKAAYIQELIAALKENQQQQRPTIVMDAGNGLYGAAFQKALIEQAELSSLLSYSGFLDMAIVTGTALSHGVARYAFLRQGEPTEKTEYAFFCTLADSLIKDFSYKHQVREALLVHVRQTLGGSPDNFWVPPLDLEELNQFLETEMQKESKVLLRNLEKSGIIYRLEPYTQLRPQGIQLENYRFPWDRAFEIGMDIQLNGFTEE